MDAAGAHKRLHIPFQAFSPWGGCETFAAPQGTNDGQRLEKARPHCYSGPVLYQWIKAIHLISLISWMAGTLYLLRLFVYHAMETEQVVRDRLAVMERRLQKAIATPAMIATLATGIWMLVLVPLWLKQPWMHVKLTCVFALAGVHGMSGGWRKRLITEPNFKSHKFFRVMNEVPTLLMVIIVIMVIVRPFAKP